MTELEDRLRQDLHDMAQRVAPANLRPLRAPSRHRPYDGKSRGRAMVPIAAAVAVAMIAAGTAVLLPRLLTGRQHQGPPSHVATGAAVPKFFVAIAYSRVSDATRLEVVATATGQVVGSLAPPTAARSFQAVAPLGNNRTFVVEASGRRCDTWFYRFRLSAQGQPTGLAPLAVPEVPGHVVVPLEPDPVPLAASANGNVVAFSTQRCANTSGRTYLGQVGTIDLATRTVTTWKFRWPAAPWSLSLSADGSLLEFVSNPSNGQRYGSDALNEAWTLRTDSAGGWLAQHYRRVIGPPAAPTAAVVSPDGRVTFAVVPVQPKRPGRWHDVLRAYKTASGRLTREILSFPVIRQGPSVSADPSGRYLLAFFLTDRVKWIDLTTGRLGTIAHYPAFLLDAAW